MNTQKCNLINRFPNVFVQGLNLDKNRPTSLIWTDYTATEQHLFVGTADYDFHGCTKLLFRCISGLVFYRSQALTVYLVTLMHDSSGLIHVCVDRPNVRYIGLEDSLHTSPKKSECQSQRDVGKTSVWSVPGDAVRFTPLFLLNSKKDWHARCS